MAHQADSILAGQTFCIDGFIMIELNLWFPHLSNFTSTFNMYTSKNIFISIALGKLILDPNKDEKRLMSIILKYHNHTQQTSPRHREEEYQSINSYQT